MHIVNYSIYHKLTDQMKLSTLQKFSRRYKQLKLSNNIAHILVH
jgi:hypothetical protein